MKTILINCSPKRKLSVSSYLLGLVRLFVKGRIIKEFVRTPKDYDRVLQNIQDGDAVVFGIPLYVDGIGIGGGFQSGSWLTIDGVTSITSDLLVFIFFQLGVLFYGIRMSHSINKGTSCGKNTPEFFYQPLYSF